MTIPLTYFPKWTVKQYDLNLHALNSKVHLELWCAVWGLPQASILANKWLWQKLAPFGYKEHTNTPVLWYHETRPIWFTLVVDDFGIQYVNKADVEHLMTSLQTTYKRTLDWTGDLYCGITLGWDYNNRYVAISMPGYIKRNSRSTDTLSPIESKTAHIICTRTQTIWDNHASPHSPRQYAKIEWCGDKTSTKKCGKHIILCPRRGHDGPHCPQLHRDETNKRPLIGHWRGAYNCWIIWQATTQQR